MSKLLVTGAGGFLGNRIVQYYRNRYDCIAPTLQELEIRNIENCRQFLRFHNPDYVIHTAAISDTGVCEANPQLAYHVNVIGTENLARACAEVKCRFIFMSSDQVYNGSCVTDKNRENDRLSPINVYGKQKLEMEQRVLKLLPEAVALRLSWMYDLPDLHIATKENFLTRILNAIAQEQEISFSNTEYRGITYVKEVVANLEKVLEVPGGVYNFGSYAKDTTYTLAEKVFQMLGAGDKTQLLYRMPDAIPRNLSMDQTLLNQHRIYFSDNESGLHRLFLQKASLQSWKL